jgi:MFS family permease
MLSTALTAPYYVLLAREQSGALKSLGLFVVAAGLAGLISGPIWGKLSDVSSRLVLVWAGIAASLTGLVAFALVQFGGTFGSLWWLIPLLYFALCVAHNGVRLGRKTYLVDMAGGTKRTDYVAISNTAIGVILLAAGLAGAAAGSVPAQVLILVFSVLSVLGSLLGLRLPEVQTG